jgi:hypothetical protein
MPRSVFGRLALLRRLLTLRPRRYRRLLEGIYRNRCRRIAEIGTYDGAQARRMIETAAIFHPPGRIEYFGFDLFERQTDADLAHELSLRPPPRAAVDARLRRTGARIDLRIGYTRDTLPRFVDEERSRAEALDFIFIDGGHAIGTVRSDWEHLRSIVRPATTVVFDDYYVDPPPAVRDKGCQAIIDSLDRSRWEVEILDPEDAFEKEFGVLRVRMVRVRLRAGAHAV